MCVGGGGGGGGGGIYICMQSGLIAMLVVVPISDLAVPLTGSQRRSLLIALYSVPKAASLPQQSAEVSLHLLIHHHIVLQASRGMGKRISIKLLCVPHACTWWVGG